VARAARSEMRPAFSPPISLPSSSALPSASLQPPFRFSYPPISLPSALRPISLLLRTCAQASSQQPPFPGQPVVAHLAPGEPKATHIVKIRTFEHSHDAVCMIQGLTCRRRGKGGWGCVSACGVGWGRVRGTGSGKYPHTGERLAERLAGPMNLDLWCGPGGGGRWQSQAPGSTHPQPEPRGGWVGGVGGWGWGGMCPHASRRSTAVQPLFQHLAAWLPGRPAGRLPGRLPPACSTSVFWVLKDGPMG
jgi:hypothetical protein